MQIPTQRNIAIESLIVDGESNSDNQMTACEKGEKGFHSPFALFSPDLQHNVGGPYAERDHAQQALDTMLEGGMVPYTDDSTVTWTVNGKPSRWYDKD